ncbi:cytochrome P450 6a8-like [Anoplophora glabripennis]|uniref:cytochrome P450 6a8-like n=1 Tax=Anoplophora glabripennis TaxID=217634 RepID=UPI0008746DFA|nr:cytochrome P450 6a8-like [Anoplophora glabripennis]
MDTIFNLATIITTIWLVGYLYCKWCKTYWQRKGLPVLEPEPETWPKEEVARADLVIRTYRRIKENGLRHAGGYRFIWPTYFPVDNEIIKCIFQKDFEHFMNHGTYLNEEGDPFSGHLFNLEGSKWRNLRAKLSPTFTSGKMKMMFPIFVECSDGLEHLLDQCIKNNEAVDIKDVAARYTTDIIGSAAFGIKCNSLIDPEAEFRKVGQKVFAYDRLTMFKYTLIALFPKSILVALGVRITTKELENFLKNVIRENIEYREKNKIVRNDFLHLLLQLKNKGKITDDDSFTPDGQKVDGGTYMTFDEVAAQCYLFFIAGFETSSTTMTFAIYELAVNQDIQDKVRKEVNEVLKKYDNKFTYEAMNEMTYLDKVFNETLRKYPPVSAIPRVCTKDYTIPGTDITIEAGTHFSIPIMGIHYDPEYYPNPEVFDPERFNEENKAKRPPYTHVPFGDGPRICIGSRFGRMQSLVGLAKIVKNFKVTLNEKAIYPLKFDTKSLILSPKGNMWVNVTTV